jgi:hypothetical protein
MRINRVFLYAGVFLLAIGGVTIAAESGAIDPAALTDLLRLWPLAVIAVGVGLALKRSRLGLQAGLVAVLVPGLVLGSAFAVLPRFAGSCGTRAEPTSLGTDQGTLAAPASISLRSGCGTLNVRTQAGDGWRLDSGSTSGRTPTIEATDGSLTIRAANGRGWDALSGGRDRWDLAIPTGEIEDITLVTNASRSHVDLAGARVGSVSMTGNLSDVVLDATSASIGDLSAVLNTGRLAVSLPASSDLAGSLRVGGGNLLICSPPNVGVRVTTRGFASEFLVEGAAHAEPTYQNAGYESALIRADLDVRLNFGSIEINPIGGCR